MVTKKGQIGLWLGLFLFVSIILLIIYFGLGGIHYKTTINGEHSGQISAVETSGIIWKTTTAYIKTDPMSSQEDAYCVIDPDVAQQLRQYSMDRVKVNVHYFAYFLPAIWECNYEPAIISSVELINNTGT
jgi:hypothetical protein